MEVPSESLCRSSWDSRTCYPWRATNLRKRRQGRDVRYFHLHPSQLPEPPREKTRDGWIPAVPPLIRSETWDRQILPVSSVPKIPTFVGSTSTAGHRLKVLHLMQRLSRSLSRFETQDIKTHNWLNTNK
jgi:hypothetical protein